MVVNKHSETFCCLILQTACYFAYSVAFLKMWPVNEDLKIWNQHWNDWKLFQMINVSENGRTQNAFELCSKRNIVVAMEA